MCRYAWLFDQCTYPIFAQLQEAQNWGAVSPGTQDQVSFLNEVQITVSGCMCQLLNIWSPKLGFFSWFTVHLQWVSEPEDKLYKTRSLICFASMQLTLFHVYSISCRSTRQSLVEVEDSESSSEASDEEEQQERRPVRSGEKVGVGRLGRRWGGVGGTMPSTACIVHRCGLAMLVASVVWVWVWTEIQRCRLCPLFDSTCSCSSSASPEDLAHSSLDQSSRLKTSCCLCGDIMKLEHAGSETGNIPISLISIPRCHQNPSFKALH